jgi:hypothetical protein
MIPLKGVNRRFMDVNTEDSLKPSLLKPLRNPSRTTKEIDGFWGIAIGHRSCDW